MRRVSAIISFNVLLGAVLLAQARPLPENIQTTEDVLKLFPPVYPPLARQARIVGEVRISIHLNENGTVESAQIIDGHPMLKQAALESARKSQFSCIECGPSGRSALIIYDFEIRDGCHFGPHCESLDSDQPLITQSHGRVVISAAAQCTCDPAATIVRFRSAKCMYLWKCGRRDASTD